MEKEIASTEQSISTWHKTDTLGISVASADKTVLDGISIWCISRVNVIRTHRGKGIGSKMLNSIIEEIKIRKDKADIIVFPGGYDGDIKKQMNFYKKNGFVNGYKPGMLIYFL